MTLVKRLYDSSLNLDDYEPKHLGLLLERLMKRMVHDLGEIPAARELRQRHEPLSPPYYRIVMLVPADGARLTDLAVPAGMTKQALGQYVDVLVRHCYLVVESTVTDRRVRIARRTQKGDALAAEVIAVYETLDVQWRAILGPDRWEEFRAALIDLSIGWDREDG